MARRTVTPERHTQKRGRVNRGAEADWHVTFPTLFMQSAIQTKEGLPEMLEQARREEPLDGWGGIKVATQEDLKP